MQGNRIRRRIKIIYREAAVQLDNLEILRGYVYHGSEWMAINDSESRIKHLLMPASQLDDEEEEWWSLTMP